MKGGRCEACEGDGVKLVEMHFLADVYVPCEVCGGKRFNEATLRVRYKGKNIAEVLEMSVREAMEHFAVHREIVRVLQTLEDVGLGYIRLGQSSPTLSGRRGPAHQARRASWREVATGTDALHPRRAHHRPALRGHPEAAAGAGPAGRGGEHGAW